MNLYPQFVTATILEWKHLLKPDKYKQVIVDSFKFMANEKRVKIIGFVIMPNHIHFIWFLTEDLKHDSAQRSLLRYTAQQIKFDLQKNHPAVLERFKVDASDREYQFWERNPKVIELYTREVLEQKLNYIHNNPLQPHWNLAERQEGYKYSSAGFYSNDKEEHEFLTHYMEVI